MAMQTKGVIFGEMVLYDAAGKPVTDAATLGAARCLMVAECCARYLQQIDGLGFGDEAEISRLTNVLALNVIRATTCNGKGLADDVRATAAVLGFDVHTMNISGGVERMDS